MDPQDREPVKPPPFALAAPAVHFDADHRPRYAPWTRMPLGGGQALEIVGKSMGNPRVVGWISSDKLYTSL